MSVIAIIVALVVIGLAVGAIGTRQGWFKDADGDNIPDAVEDAVADVKEKVEDIKEEVVDVVRTIQGKPTKAKLNALTKKQLVDAAKADFGEDIDISLKKSNIVNKVYSLYNK